MGERKKDCTSKLSENELGKESEKSYEIDRKGGLI